jgi:hypothetical protein
MVWDQYGKTVDCIDEEYHGRFVYQTKYPGAVYLGDIEVSAKVYRDLLKHSKKN